MLPNALKSFAQIHSLMQDDERKDSSMKDHRKNDLLAPKGPPVIFLSSAILLCILLSSCSGPSKKPTPSTPNPIVESQWQDARKAWLLDDVAVAQSAFSLFAERYPTDRRSGEALLSAGICAQRRGRMEEAEGLLREAQSRGGAIAARALLQRGAIAIDLNPARAAACFREAGRLAIDDETRSEASYQQGVALQRLGRFEEAQVAFQNCLQLGGSGKHSAQATLRLQYDPWFSVQVGAFLKKSLALKQSTRLQDAGFPAEIRMPGRKGSPLHRVLSGRFQERNLALQHASRVQAALGLEEVKVVP